MVFSFQREKINNSGLHSRLPWLEAKALVLPAAGAKIGLSHAGANSQNINPKIYIFQIRKINNPRVTHQGIIIRIDPSRINLRFKFDIIPIY